MVHRKYTIPGPDFLWSLIPTRQQRNQAQFRLCTLLLSSAGWFWEHWAIRKTK